MLGRLGSLTVRHRRVILLASAVLFVAAGAFGGGVASRLSSGGFNDPSAESQKAQDLLEDRFDTGSPNLVLLVTSKSGTVDSERVAACRASAHDAVGSRTRGQRHGVLLVARLAATPAQRG